MYHCAHRRDPIQPRKELEERELPRDAVDRFRTNVRVAGAVDEPDPTREVGVS
jgi:hypothetical protein